jgi:hypothetical protein
MPDDFFKVEKGLMARTHESSFHYKTGAAKSAPDCDELRVARGGRRIRRTRASGTHN